MSSSGRDGRRARDSSRGKAKGGGDERTGREALEIEGDEWINRDNS